MTTADFEAGYRLGYPSGWHVGYRFAYHEQAEQDRRRQAYMHGIARLPAYSELERKRWDGPRERFGDPRPGDYMGGPVDWETSKPIAKDTA